MKQRAEVGNNRTSRSGHRDLYDEMEKGTREFEPTSSGDGPELIAEVRSAYARAGGPLGHVPAPEDAGSVPAEFVDKLGERLAFERTGTRLYDALVSKLDAFGSFEGGPDRAELLRFRTEEHEHFLMLAQVIEDMGGDPAAVTPSADVAATLSRGVADILTDARTNLLQGLEAILVAELADGASWMLLSSLAAQNGHRDLARVFQKAEATEENHRRHVLRWIGAGHGLGPVNGATLVAGNGSEDPTVRTKASPKAKSKGKSKPKP